MLGARLTGVARGSTLKSASADGDGVTWTTTYGVVGMDAIGDPQLLTDGMNERGLYAAALYIPGFAEYEQPSADAGRTHAILDAAVNALSTCATVAEGFAHFSHLPVGGPANTHPPPTP